MLLKYLPILALTALIAACQSPETTEVNSPTSSEMTEQPTLNPQLEAELAEFEAGFDQIPETRRAALRELASFIREQALAGKPADVTFICTHNSRRSHMSQLWAQAAAIKCGLHHVTTYSGGTEATAFNPRSVKALRTCGFDIADGSGENPHYTVSFGTNTPSVEAFSKTYDDPFNPQSDFCAVMTCSHADEACPIVYGAAARVSLPYIDPKMSDNTPEEDSTYLARSREIGREIYWAMQQVSK
jgi:protein-tyrosine-phosphatase